MIKINVVTSNKSWHKYISDPSAFIEKRVSLVNKNIKNIEIKYFIYTAFIWGRSH